MWDTSVYVCLWDAYETTYGIPMGCLWDTYGMPMGYLWDAYRMPMGCIWDTSVYVCLWDVLTIYGDLWCCRFTLSFCSVVYGEVYVILWVCGQIPMGNLCDHAAAVWHLWETIRP